MSKYIIFWETRVEPIYYSLDVLAVLLKMIEKSSSVDMWGRCEGVETESGVSYNGFVLFNEFFESVDTFIKRYEKYIYITGYHKFTTVDETKKSLSTWKRLNK